MRISASRWCSARILLLRFICIRLSAVIAGVLVKKHVAYGKKLSVEPYIDCLGVLPPGFDSSLPFQALPPDLYLDCPLDFIKYRLQNHRVKQKVTK